MKNSIKLGALALALAVSFTACSGKKSTSGADSTAKDTTVKTDTAKKDTTAKDTSKMKMSTDTARKKM